MFALKLYAELQVFMFLLQIRSVSSSGHFFHLEYKCFYSGDNLKVIETYQQCFYDRVLVMRFNRSISTFFGYTKWTTALAEDWQKKGYKVKEMNEYVDGICGNALALYKQIKDHRTQPYIKLHQVSPPKGSHPAMLQCSVYGFYPKQIKVTWMKNGQDVTTGASSTEVLSNGHWSYQAHSKLVLPSQDAGERISCVVEHASFSKPKEHYWDPTMSTSNSLKIVVGSISLVLGITAITAVGIWYRKKGLGYCSCNTSIECKADSLDKQITQNSQISISDVSTTSSTV